MKKILSSMLLLILISSCQSGIRKSSNVENAPKHLYKPYVIMVSIDGYRYDYTKRFQPPHLSKLMKEGIYSKGLIPVFPSKTFPNHYSLVTGLRAGNHGIVANRFWDPERKARYKLGDSSTTTDGSWYRGEPIWIAAEKDKMVSASYFWVGSDANIQNMYPTYYVPYNGSVPNSERVNQVLEWLKLPEKERPHYITLYFSDVDSVGHRHGTDSEEIKNAVLSIDKEIGTLISGLKKINLPVNVIVVSDHGMQNLNPKKKVTLSDYINVDNVRIEGKGTQALLYYKNKKLINSDYKKLKKAKAFKVYKRGKLPSHYGYDDPRVGDLIISTKSPYYLQVKKTLGPGKSGGTHGYDPKHYKNMRGVFYAAGPNVKKKGLIRSFENIHVYPFVMRMLGLDIKTKIDGKSKVLSKYLK